MTTKHLYIPLLRPASSFTLPQGVRWEYTQAPASLAAARADLPRSTHPHGVIAIDRALTTNEIEHFDLQPLLTKEITMKTKTTTIKEAKSILVAFKMTISKRDGEYRVNFVGGVEATAYYTNDIDDAISTAQVMRGRATRNEYLAKNPLALTAPAEPLYWHEVQLMRTSIPHWIAAYRIAKIAADQSALADSARANMANAMRQMITIGDKLTADLMPGCTTIAALVGKHADHGYRPTLRADAGRVYALLADVYDFYAEAHGLEVRAYRG